MDNDYRNFVERMGGIVDEMDLSTGAIVHEPVSNVVTRNRSAVLSHHGVLGMKWGHRKASGYRGAKHSRLINQNVLSKATKAGQDGASLGQSINRNRYNRHALKEAKSMSDEELKKLTARLNLENNYMNAKNIQSGKGKIDSILSVAGGTLALVSSAAMMVDAIQKARR